VFEHKRRRRAESIHPAVRWWRRLTGSDRAQ
jgi:hypothetical protein